MGDAWVKLHDEIKAAQRHCKSGKISKEDATLELKFFKRREQVLKQMITIRMYGYPNGGRPFLNSLGNVQLYDEYEAVKVLETATENETLFCRDQDAEITRAACLEYSGEKEHFEACRECETGRANKRLLCPQ